MINDRKNTLIIIICIAIIGIIFLFQRTGNKIQRLNNRINYQKAELDYSISKINFLKSSLFAEYSTRDLKLNDFTIIGLDNKEASISSLVNKETYLVLRFSEHSCNVCIDSLVTMLKKRIIDRHEMNKLLFLVSYENSRSMLILKDQYQLNKNFFLIEPNISILDSFNTPYLFTLDSTLIPKMILFPDNNYSDITSEYLEFIEKKFYFSN